MEITISDLQIVAGNKTRSKVATEFVTAFNEFAPNHDINTVARVSLFLAQMVPETGGFTSITESLNYSVDGLLKTFGRHRISKSDAEKYGRSGKRKANQKAIANAIYGGAWGKKNLGNIKPNDGWDFRGAGPGQQTGRANFARAEKLTGIPFTTEPQRMHSVREGLLATMALWKLWDMNSYADKRQVTASRKKWNGGDHGLKETLAAWKRGNELSFGIDAPEKANPTSKILPLYRPKQSDAVTLAILDKFETIATPDNELRILVARGYYQDSMGAKGKNDRAMYDDAIFVVSPTGIQSFNGNSDPSVFRDGVATIKAPQTIRYRPGLHGYSRAAGPYPAFRQDSDATVLRDNQQEQHGMFHVNFHRGGVNGTSSLGCLTVPPHQWDEFYGLVKGLLDSLDQKTFLVTVVEYAGDNPPVTIPKPQEIPVKTTTVAVVTGVGLVVSWWDQITAFFERLF